MDTVLPANVYHDMAIYCISSLKYGTAQMQLDAHTRVAGWKSAGELTNGCVQRCGCP